MLITENPELTRLMLTHLSDLYHIKQKRVGIHLSTLVYCLTKSQMDVSGGIEPTDNEVMLFALGLGLQDVLTPGGTATPVYTKDGIIYSPDFVFELGGWLVELKTTRQSAKRGAAHEFPETWIEYIKGGSYIVGKEFYDLSVLYLMGNYSPPFPLMKSFRLEFTPEELEENWNHILDRKAVYEKHIESRDIILPKKYAKSWECSYCRFKLVCDTILTEKRDTYPTETVEHIFGERLD